MTLTWKIKFPIDTKSWSDQEIADFIMPEFWLKPSEYRLTDKGIEGTPSTISSWFISPIGIAVYDIVASYDRSKNTLIIHTRLYKLYAVLSPFIIGGIITTFNSLILGLIISIAPILFFGLSAVVQLEISRMDIVKKLKNNGHSF